MDTWISLPGSTEKITPLYQETDPGTDEQLEILMQRPTKSLVINFDRLRAKRGNDRTIAKPYSLAELKDFASQWGISITKLGKAAIVDKLWEEARIRYPEQVVMYL
jgi:hypothetical protein